MAKLNNEIKVKIGECELFFKFDKNGGLCNMRPYVPEIMNDHRGQTRLCIPEIVNLFK